MQIVVVIMPVIPAAPVRDEANHFGFSEMERVEIDPETCSYQDRYHTWDIVSLRHGDNSESWADLARPTSVGYVFKECRTDCLRLREHK